MSREKAEDIRKSADGRRHPVLPNTPLAQRLQEKLGGSEISKAARIFSCTWDTAKRYLSGENLPNAGQLADFIEATNSDGHWLLMGETHASGPVVAEPATGYGNDFVHTRLRVGDQIRLEYVGEGLYGLRRVEPQERVVKEVVGGHS